MFLELYDSAIDCVKERDSRFSPIKWKSIGDRELFIVPYHLDSSGDFVTREEHIASPRSIVLGYIADQVFKILISNGKFTFSPEPELIIVILLSDPENVEVPVVFPKQCIDLFPKLYTSTGQNPEK